MKMIFLFKDVHGYAFVLRHRQFYNASTSGTFTLNISEQTLTPPPIVLSNPGTPENE